MTTALILRIVFDIAREYALSYIATYIKVLVWFYIIERCKMMWKNPEPLYRRNALTVTVTRAQDNRYRIKVCVLLVTKRFHNRASYCGITSRWE
jgi:hypothetical protein